MNARPDELRGGFRRGKGKNGKKGMIPHEECNGKSYSVGVAAEACTLVWISKTGMGEKNKRRKE
uniref:Uncharacterized protein n=1 Tax=Pristionchus pacificus TaxID=54126 RepID=A0A2A6D018_PRIPA|eukprot:PDM83749.1 hypothetical protein PRIPAC_30236 [Pristionchus pacificus]